MQLSSILSACARNGVTVTQPCPERKGNPYYVLRKGENVLEFYTNADGYVGHLTSRHPDTDAMTDLFMDSYFHTIKSAMHFLNPSGELVQRVHPVITETTSNIVDGVSVTINEKKHGIEIRFNEKPTTDIINTLKDKGFRWSPYNTNWWKKYNDADYQWAMETFCKEPVIV